MTGKKRKIVEMKKLFLLLSAAAACFSVEARQLMTDQDKPASWKGMVKFEPGAARKKGPCFILYGRYPTPLIYNKYLPVSPDKTYIYKASFRAFDKKYPASAYLGLELYDKNKRLLGFRNVSPMVNTESVVVSANKGDRFMIVKKFPSYDKIRIAVVAFGVKKDFSDIPNFDLSPQTSAMKADGKDNVRIEFKAPLKKSYPAGTAVRLHSPWAPSMYYLVSGWMPAGDGKDFTVKLQGINNKPGTGRDKFWKGTAYIRPFVWFGNWNRRPGKEAKLLVDGLSLEETEASGK